MGSELLTERKAPLSYKETFEKAFPFYLSIGMTYEQYWLMDSSLTKAYIEAYRIKVERSNYDAWLQGRYYYDALCMVSPIFNANAKRGTKPIPYHEKPYEVGKKTESEKTIERDNRTQEKKHYDEVNMKLKKMFSTVNAKFKKDGDNNGND